MPVPIFAEMSSGDWLAVGSTVGGGLITAATIVGTALKYAVNKLVEMRREERKHEASTAAKFTEATKEIQDQAATDNREAFKALVDIQKETIQTVAAVSGAVRELTASVTELRHEMIGRAEKRKRPRTVREQSGQDGDD